MTLLRELLANVISNKIKNAKYRSKRKCEILKQTQLMILKSETNIFQILIIRESEY